MIFFLKNNVVLYIYINYFCPIIILTTISTNTILDIGGGYEFFFKKDITSLSTS